MRLGSDTLTLVVNQRPMTVPLAGVIRIEVPGDPLANGAIIGAAVFGAWCAFVCGQGLDDSSQLGSAVAVNTVLGAAIDAAHKGRTPIYQRRAVSVHLDAGPDRPGVTRRGPATMAHPIRLGRTARLSMMLSYAF